MAGFRKQSKKTGKSGEFPPPASLPSEGYKFTTHLLVALVACLTPGDVAKVSAPGDIFSTG